MSSIAEKRKEEKTTAQFLLEGIRHYKKAIPFFKLQRQIDVAANLSRLERVDVPTGGYRYYLRFDDRSMLVVLVNDDENVSMLEAYSHMATEDKEWG